MAKLSSIQKNLHRRKLVEQKKATRTTLKATIMDRSLPFEERIMATQKLNAMPKNSAAARIRNRCLITGRPRGYYRKFQMSRISLRELGSHGEIPGLTKASW